jgi:hypothetical protein
MSFLEQTDEIWRDSVSTYTSFYEHVLSFLLLLDSEVLLFTLSDSWSVVLWGNKRREMMRLAGTANRGRCWGTLLLLLQLLAGLLWPLGMHGLALGIPAPTWGCIISLSDSFSCIRCSNWKWCEGILDCRFQENICTFKLTLKECHRTVDPWMVCAQEVLPFSWWVCNRALFLSPLAALTPYQYYDLGS